MALQIPTQAITDLQYLSKRLSGIIDLIPYLEQLPQLENAIKERTTVLEKYTEELNQVLQSIEAERLNLDEIRNEQDEYVAEATTKTQELLEKAKADADAYVVAQKQKLQDELTVMSVELDTKTAELHDLQNKKNTLTADISTKEDHLRSIERRLKELKDTL